MELKIIKTLSPKLKPEDKLKFGTVFTDHMFTMEYTNGEWANAQIRPYAPFSLDPASSVFHYGQAIFEGAKAYKNTEGQIRLFRFDQNLKRLNESARRLCIPQIDEQFVFDAVEKLIVLDKDWIPTKDGTSLYIRPAIIATEAALGVHASSSYIFFCILCPVGAYYENGIEPVKLYVETDYVRAAKGGTGQNKVAGNYASSLIAGEKAVKLGYNQVMWLDSKEHKYIEEVGAMNIMFVSDGKIITPALSGSILPGITRKSIIELAISKKIVVEERVITIDEVTSGVLSGNITEIFGTGTAAVISPVGQFIYKDTVYTIGEGKIGNKAKIFYEILTGIQTGKLEDTFNWTKIIQQ